MGSFKTVLKSIRPFFVDRLARNVHFNTNPIDWFLLNQPKMCVTHDDPTGRFSKSANHVKIVHALKVSAQQSVRKEQVLL